MTAENLPEELLQRVSEAVEAVREFSQVRLISHYDADGISSAGVLSNAILREGIGLQVSMVKSLEKDLVGRLREEGHDCIVFSDMGSGLLEELEELDARVIVLDHHRPRGDSDRVVHVNPHLWGIDGMTGSSASAVCMLFAVSINEENWELLPVAFAGIAGDKQDVRGLSGINSWLLEGGQTRGLVEVRRRSLVPEGPLGRIAERFDPYIKGVSGDADGAEALLREADLAPDEEGRSIDEGKRRKLTSLLTLRLLEQGVDTSTLDELTGQTYYFPGWKMESGEIASLLNASGRMNCEGVGLALTMGDAAAKEEAIRLRSKYDQEVLRALDGVGERVKIMDNIQFFHNQNPSLSGVACGITMQYIADKSKPTLALAEKGGKLRVSSRATHRILEMGVDLSEALRIGADRTGGVGGGHAIASGATIPVESEGDFLKAVDAIVGEQKSKRDAEDPTSR